MRTLSTTCPFWCGTGDNRRWTVEEFVRLFLDPLAAEVPEAPERKATALRAGGRRGCS